MTSTRLSAVSNSLPAAMELPLQEASQDIWDKKYRLKTKDGQPIDTTVDAT